MCTVRVVFLTFGRTVIMNIMNSGARVFLHSAFYFPFIVYCYGASNKHDLFSQFYLESTMDFQVCIQTEFVFLCGMFFSSLYLSLLYYFCSCLDFFFRRRMCCWKAKALGKRHTWVLYWAPSLALWYWKSYSIP